MSLHYFCMSLPEKIQAVFFYLAAIQVPFPEIVEGNCRMYILKIWFCKMYSVLSWSCYSRLYHMKDIQFQPFLCFLNVILIWDSRSLNWVTCQKEVRSPWSEFTVREKKRWTEGTSEKESTLLMKQSLHVLVVEEWIISAERSEEREKYSNMNNKIQIISN